jgi:hypothetical protein
MELKHSEHLHVNIKWFESRSAWTRIDLTLMDSDQQRDQCELNTGTVDIKIGKMNT